MRVTPDVLKVFGEHEERVRTILNARQLTAVTTEKRGDQTYLKVITPWPIDFKALNEAQNILRAEHGLAVYLESINPDHLIARHFVEAARDHAFFGLVLEILRKHQLLGPRFTGKFPDEMIIKVFSRDPFEWTRLNEAQNELRNYATFEIFIEPRSEFD